MKRVAATLAILMLTALPASMNPMGAKSMTDKNSTPIKVSEEKLVAEFVRGLVRAEEFESVKHLFLSLGDFPGLLEELKKAPGLPEYKRRQLQGKHNLRKQKVALKNSIQKNIRAPWNKLRTTIKDENVRVRFSEFKSKTRVQGGLKIYEIKLKLIVTRASRDVTVRKHIKAMKIGSKLKIVRLFQRI